MVDTDWREILSFSQKELGKADKEKLCESLSWMEADDIELNFTDLKTLFRLAQDILKYKNEQVNNLTGQLETAQRKSKTKGKTKESPTRSGDSVLETIAHQEEVIKANKDILEQLYADIAELEGRKQKLEEDRYNVDRDSESSRDALSEMNAIAQLESELTMKNRHIRKLLGDVKVLEEENTKLKEKVTILKDKLTEATQLIENLTEQLFTANNENLRIKEVLGKTEKLKAEMSLEMESLRKELFEKESSRENIFEEVKAKVQHWKNIARSKKAEIEALSEQNTKLKEDLIHVSQTSSPQKSRTLIAEESKIKELQEKLAEASNEIEGSAKLIEILKAENKQLKSALEEAPDISMSDTKNESDDGKERALINKLKRKVKMLTVSLQGAEEMIANREKELTEIASQLQLLKSDEGVSALVEGLKNKKRKLKQKDEGIKSLVQEINGLHQTVNDLQLENETLRQKMNISPNHKIATTGIMKKFRNIEQNNLQLTKGLRKSENRLITSELENHKLRNKVSRLMKLLNKMGCKQDDINEICKDDQSEDEEMPKDGGGEASTILSKQQNQKHTLETNKSNEEVQSLIEENEGLRKGLQEMLNFLKDNSTTSSGILSIECPSLDAILRSMEARHSAGWFAPHMATVMELRAALGGKDALLSALHEARKETLDVMEKLNKESQKSQELEQKLNEIESKSESQKVTEASLPSENISFGEFGTWMLDKELIDVDFFDRNQIDTLVNKGNSMYEKQLKHGLVYFHEKFKNLYEKMASLTVQAADDRNKWSIQEEKYKAEIENLKVQIIVNDEEDNSEISPGVVSIPNVSSLQRKCNYLEESYKYIRTLNENMKSEYLECKRDALLLSAKYENQIQKLMLSVANLTDKLRSSISLELFWKQNEMLNEVVTKHRKIVEEQVNKTHNFSSTLFDRLENDKIQIISHFSSQKSQIQVKEDTEVKAMLSTIEQTVLAKQLQQICAELENKNKEIEKFKENNMLLQDSQSKLIDKSLASITNEDVDLMKEQLEKLADENKILKDQCQHVESQLDIALLQLQDNQQRQMSNDMEINLLRHQILDLQSTGDNKAIIARLSGEVLIAHLQATESHKKIERLNSALNKEKQMRIEAEEMLRARKKIFDVYAFRYDTKFRYMYEVMRVLRHQYQGAQPTIVLENFLNSIEDLSRKTHDVNEKLDEIEDLRSSLMTKHTVFNQILDVSKNKCLDDEDSCSHKLQNLVMQGTHSREMDYYKNKINSLENSREELLKRCNHLEKTLVLVNKGFTISHRDDKTNKVVKDNVQKIEVEDVMSDDESSSKGNLTITLQKPKVLKPLKSNMDMTKVCKEDVVDPLLESSLKTKHDLKPAVVNVAVQTLYDKHFEKKYIAVQTDQDVDAIENKRVVADLRKELDKKNTELAEIMKLSSKRAEEILSLSSERNKYDLILQTMKESNSQKDKLNERLQSTVDYLNKQINCYKQAQATEKIKMNEVINEENNTLKNALKTFENEKNAIVGEYKDLLNKERNQYAQSIKELQMKILDLESQLLDRKASDTNAGSEVYKEAISKYTIKITQLEDKCFKYQSDLDGCKTELRAYQSEVDRWKDLANERLIKMEQLSSKLEERHCHEVESYKAENEHWLSQLGETQREHQELRSRLTDQKTTFVKQMSDKDAQIEQLRSVVHGLKTQIMSMQTMISATDPSFDLSAIVEVDEASDLSQQESDRLELKYDSSADLNDMQDEARTGSTTSVWQEPAIERLRREKQLTMKQNALLRRQIKALAARERRARLDAQNLKSQVFRISTSGSKVSTAETAALHNKIASLQAQLTTARRDSHSTVALWDKWKRAQQTAERWQARYSEKCQEVKKIEASLSLAKSAVARLEKEKRVLLNRLTEAKDKGIERLELVEKQDGESSEKMDSPIPQRFLTSHNESPVSTRALLDRVQAQQRRIAALEVAEKGNEHLVSEFEKSMAEVTSLKGQVLKLESALLESQIKTPISKQDQQPELEYWKSYCEMLKEENVQLNLRVNSLETTPVTANQHRVNDLEQTVLTLRGLVSKLQAEQKATGILHRRPESRPSSGRSSIGDKNRTQLESYRLEIANLKRSLNDKDLLLERSKEMLKIAADREDELLRENASLRRQLYELTTKRGVMSA